jgi:hypothetical protein
MTLLSAQAMTGLLTLPYRRGGETLDIPIGADVGGSTSIPLYNFGEYRARYEVDPPSPKYIIFPKKETGRDELLIEVEGISGGIITRATVKIPPQTFAEVSFLIPLPTNADAGFRLRSFRQLPLPLPGPGADNWGIIALLGNISKLAWVLGREKDEIRQHLLDVERQRLRAFAHGYSLDKLGEDLRVPRFPAREHSFDLQTVALYHFNDAVANNGAVADETARFGLTGHPGINVGAQSGVNGKFGRAFSFPGAGPAGAIEIAHHADFNINANASFTAETFIKAESIDDPAPRNVMMKRAQEVAGQLLIAGWSISLGTFRGIVNNVMWAVGDGAREIKIFADVNVADGKIHHLAGTIDRAAQRARLYLDGEELANADINAFGAIANNEKVRIGRSATGNQFSGMIDEVRLSKVARSDFHPVLGEGDEAYRQRLGIFKKWLLPTPQNLLRTINSLVRINGEADSFRLIEKNRPAAVASKLLKILPASLLAGQRINYNGDLRSEETDASGLPADDVEFNEIYLFRHDRAEIDYLGAENNHRMQKGTKDALDRLLSLLVGTPGKLILKKSFDAADPGLHSVGRALLLNHQTLATEKLGLLALRAGFSFVSNTGTDIYASITAEEKLEIAIEPRVPLETPPADIDLFSGKALDLHLAPETLPINGQIKWTLIPCGPGRAHFEKHPADTVNLPTPLTSRLHLRLIADAPGEVVVRVEYTFQHRTVSGTRTILISIDALKDNETISIDGDMKIVEARAVGTPEALFNPLYLITSDASVNFGASPNNKKMQIILERPFKRLLKLLQSSGAATSQLQVLKAFDPAGPGLHKVGRAIRFTHAVVNAGALGALAHQAGFGFVQRQNTEIFAAVAEGERIEIVRSSDLAPLDDELTVGTPIQIQARFSTLPPANTGNFNWSVEKGGYGDGSFDFVLRPNVKFTPTRAGLLALNVTFLEQDAQSTFPYTFEIRLKDALNLQQTIIAKHQYDLLMNILSYFRPIGVEIITGNIREHVVEVKDNLLNAFPGYTYPDFRA